MAVTLPAFDSTPRLLVTTVVSLWASDSSYGFSVIACKEQDQIRKVRDLLPFGKVVGKATYPNERSHLLALYFRKGSEELVETSLTLTKEPEERKLTAKLVQAEAVSGPMLGKAPVFEEIATKEASGNSFRVLRLVGFGRKLVLSEILAEPAVRVARIAEAKILLRRLQQARDNAGHGARVIFSMRRLVACDGEGRTALMNVQGLEAGCAAMAKHQSAPALQEQACALIRNVAAAGSKAWEKLRSLEAVASVILAMNMHKTHAGVQEQGCGALGNMACIREAKEAIANGGGIKLLIEATDAFNDAPGVLTQAIGAVWNLGVNSVKNRETFVSEGYVEKLIEVMKAHEDDAPLQTVACGALGNLVAQSVEGKGIAATSGYAVLVCRAMSHFKHEAQLQRHACGALWTLGANCLRNQEETRNANGFRLISAAMLEHNTNADVLEAACGALRSLTAHSEDNKAEAFDQKLHLRVFDALRDYPNHAGVQKQACGALWNMTATNSLFVHETIIDVAGQDGGPLVVELLLKTFENHEKNAAVIEAACGCFRNLVVSNPEVQPTLIKAELIERLGKVMENHALVVPVQRQCFEIIASVSQRGQEACERIVRSSALEAVVASMAKHVDDSLLQERACHAFRWLADERSGTRASVIKVNGAHRICEGMKKHLNSMSVQLRAVGALFHLISGDANDRTFTNAINIAIVTTCEAMKKHLDSETLQEAACGVLRRVCEVGKEQQMATLNKGAIDLVNSAMQRHPFSLAVQQQGCRFFAIQAMGSAKAVAQMAKERCGIQIAGALEDHVSDVQVVSAGLEALLSLIAADPTNSCSFVDTSDAVVKVSELLAMHADHEDVQRLSCELVWRVVRLRKRYLSQALQVGLLPEVRRILCKHEGTTELQLHALMAMQELEKGAKAENSGSDPMGTAESVLAVMRANMDTAIIQQRCCESLQILFAMDKSTFMQPSPSKEEFDAVWRRLTANRFSWFEGAEGPAEDEVEKDDINKQDDMMMEKEEVEDVPSQTVKLDTFGDRACLLLCEVADLHSGISVLQQNVFATLWSLTNNNPGAKFSAVKSGSLKVISSAMEAFPKHIGVQRHAISAIWGMVANNSIGKDVAVTLRLCSLIVGSIDMFPTDETLQESACGAIASIASGNSNCQIACVDAGAVERICNVMSANPASEAVQLRGAAALAAVANDNPACRSLFSSTKAIKLLCKALDRHRRNVNVGRYVCRALGAAAIDDTGNKQLVLENDGITSVLWVMENFIRDAALQRHACQLLQTISYGNESCQEFILEAGGIEPILEAMAVNLEDAALQRQAISALGNLAFKSDVAKKTVRKADGLKMIIAAVTTHKLNASVLCVAFWAVGNLAANSAKIQHVLVQANFRDLIQVGMALHSSADTVQTYGSKTLRRLEGAEDRESEAETIGSDESGFVANVQKSRGSAANWRASGRFTSLIRTSVTLNGVDLVTEGGLFHTCANFFRRCCSCQLGSEQDSDDEGDEDENHI
eukprot:TRINITY_DN30261_c0_g1_i1.p1 TRINITY_DN30261_c0_g1~~TRINITY_DN30261_c0_g1_i1.p1  ORF type:complete len:1558 (+),score=300.90 TRINITY_DN30261_c0_g1_i1:181-4674(+)